MELAKMITEAKLNGEDDAIAALSDDLSQLLRHAEQSALSILQQEGVIAPTFMLMSKAGSGFFIPIVLDEFPPDHESRIALAGPLAMLVGLAPIDSYYFISSMWAAPDRAGESRKPAQRPDRINLVLIRAFSRTQAQSACYTVVRHPITEQPAALYPFRGPVGVYDTSNPCLMNLYELANQVFDSMSPAEIKKFKLDVLGI